MVARHRHRLRRHIRHARVRLGYRDDVAFRQTFHTHARVVRFARIRVRSARRRHDDRLRILVYRQRSQILFHDLIVRGLRSPVPRDRVRVRAASHCRLRSRHAERRRLAVHKPAQRSARCQRRSVVRLARALRLHRQRRGIHLQFARRGVDLEHVSDVDIRPRRRGIAGAAPQEDLDVAEFARHGIANILALRRTVVQSNEVQIRIEAFNLDFLPVNREGNLRIVALHLALDRIAFLRIAVVHNALVVHNDRNNSLLRILRDIGHVAGYRIGNSFRFGLCVLPSSEIVVRLRIDLFHREDRRIAAILAVRVGNVLRLVAVVINQRTILALVVGNGEGLKLVVELQRVRRALAVDDQFVHRVLIVRIIRGVADALLVISRLDRDAVPLIMRFRFANLSVTVIVRVFHVMLDHERGLPDLRVRKGDIHEHLTVRVLNRLILGDHLHMVAGDLPHIGSAGRRILAARDHAVDNGLLLILDIGYRGIVRNAVAILVHIGDLNVPGVQFDVLNLHCIGVPILLGRLNDHMGDVALHRHIARDIRRLERDRLTNLAGSRRHLDLGDLMRAVFIDILGDRLSVGSRRGDNQQLFVQLPLGIDVPILDNLDFFSEVIRQRLGARCVRIPALERIAVAVRFGGHGKIAVGEGLILCHLQFAAAQVVRPVVHVELDRLRRSIPLGEYLNVVRRHFRIPIEFNTKAIVCIPAAKDIVTINSLRGLNLTVTRLVVSKHFLKRDSAYIIQSSAVAEYKLIRVTSIIDCTRTLVHFLIRESINTYDVCFVYCEALRHLSFSVFFIAGIINISNIISNILCISFFTINNI